MAREWNQRLAASSRRWIVLGALISLLILGYGDYWTGYHLQLSSLFVIPILLVTWRAGLRVGLVFCLIAGLCFAFVESLAVSIGTHPAAAVWNVATKTFLFVVIAYVFHQLNLQLQARRQEAEAKETAKRELEQLNDTLEQRVDERTLALQEVNRRLEEEIQSRTAVELQNEILVRLTADNTHPVARLSSDGRLLYANAAAQQIFAEENGDCLPAAIVENTRDALETQRSIDVEFEIGERNFSLTFLPVPERNYVNLYAFDVTERRRLEQEILDISDQERQRFAQDLHDGLCQELMGIQYLCASLRKKLDVQGWPEATLVADIRRFIEESLQHARGIARGISPVDPSGEALLPSLEQMGQWISATTKIACRVSSEWSLEKIEPTKMIHLFRIAQEAVNNAVRHAKPTTIDITLVEEERERLLIIRNDGAPFQQGAPRKPHGLGLRIMEYRARLLGGTLALDATEDHHTEVICRIPNHSFMTCEEDSHAAG